MGGLAGGASLGHSVRPRQQSEGCGLDALSLAAGWRNRGDGGTNPKHTGARSNRVRWYGDLWPQAKQNGESTSTKVKFNGRIQGALQNGKAKHLLSPLVLRVRGSLGGAGGSGEQASRRGLARGPGVTAIGSRLLAVPRLRNPFPRESSQILWPSSVTSSVVANIPPW